MIEDGFREEEFLRDDVLLLWAPFADQFERAKARHADLKRRGKGFPLPGDDLFVLNY